MIFLFTLCIPCKNWQNACAKHATLDDSSRPKYFRASFSKYLTRIAQKNGLYCSLKITNKKNWFSRESQTWSGHFRCSDPRCDINFRLNSEKIIEGNIVKVHLYAAKKPNHSEPVEYPVTNTSSSSTSASSSSTKPVVIKSEQQSINEIKQEPVDRRIEPKNNNHHHRHGHNCERKNRRSQQVSKSKKLKLMNLKKEDETNTNDDNEQIKQEQQQQQQLSIQHPLEWNADDVHQFLIGLVGVEIAHKFRAQQIDGKALEYLRIETLVQVLEIKLGLAARIKSEFEGLVKVFA